MMWPFTKKKHDQVPKLEFKSGAAFIAYQCDFGQTEILPEQRGILALVMDASKEVGAKTAVMVNPDGVQQALLKVASEDGGFTVLAQTAGKGDRLEPDDVVLWLPMSYSEEIVTDGLDDRFGWIGLILGKVKPEIDMNKPNFEFICKYS